MRDALARAGLLAATVLSVLLLTPAPAVAQCTGGLVNSLGMAVAKECGGNYPAIGSVVVTTAALGAAAVHAVFSYARGAVDAATPAQHSGSSLSTVGLATTAARVEAVRNLLEQHNPANGTVESIRPEAQRARDLLDDAGVDPQEIWGDLPADDLARTCAENVLCRTEFGRAVRQRMVGQASAFAFAFGGRGDPRAFADLYEYYKARYDATVRELAKPGTNKRQALINAADHLTTNSAEVEQQLSADRAKVAELGRGPVMIDATTPQNELLAAVIAKADSLGFRSNDAAAYHARKHHHELPRFEQLPADPLWAYHDSLRTTLVHGELAKQVPGVQGRSTRLVIHREAFGYSGDLAKFEAVVYVHQNGRVVLATYGKAKVKLDLKPRGGGR